MNLSTLAYLELIYENLLIKRYEDALHWITCLNNKLNRNKVSEDGFCKHGGPNCWNSSGSDEFEFIWADTIQDEE